MKKAPAANTASRRLFWLASLMFFLSGGTGLVYQIIWFKRFAHVWGSSSLAFASVGGSFLFGLGAGAWFIGRYADEVERPLRWYGVCEMAIGAAAIIMPLEIHWLIDLSGGLYKFLPDDPLIRYALQFCVTLAVVGPPCVLMGGTLPLLIRELTNRDGELDQATGWLYAINTYGAAAGCYLAGFQLLPTMGLAWTNNFTAALNVGIGVVAVLLSSQVPGRAQRSTVRSGTAAALPSGSLFALYVAVTLSGLAALILEMTWSRQLALVLGGSTYAYTATLFVVLSGIATGGLIFHLGLRRSALNAWLPIVVISVLVGGCLVGNSLLPWLSTQVGGHRDMRASLLGNAVLCVAASSIVELLPAIAMGILFPLFVDLTREQSARVGRAVGIVYAWNTFGSIAGASLTAIILFPRIGTAGALGLATAMYVITLLLVLPLDTLGRRVQWCIALAVGVSASFVISRPINPLLTNMGGYLYGNQASNMQFLDCPYFVEGASCNVALTRSSDIVSLRVNGKSDASDGKDMTTQLGLAYVPRIFCPDARDVLVIGFGSGTTPGASLLFQDTKVTCCEIEPAVFGAASYFNHVNHRPQERTRSFLEQANADLPRGDRLTEGQLKDQARLTMVFGDGRMQLQGSDQLYDLIISEPSNPWVAGVANLFTQEFFQIARARLKPGGLVAQWIQTYHFSISDYLMIVRTMRTVFPHCGLISLTHGDDTLLLASESPLIPSRDDADKMQRLVDASPEISRDLQRWFNTIDIKILLLSHYKGSQESLENLVETFGTDRLNTDSNLRLEFDAPLHIFQRLAPELDARQQLAGLSDLRWREHLGSVIGAPPKSPEYKMSQVLESVEMERPDIALPVLREAVAVQPDLAYGYQWIADTYAKQGKPQPAIATLTEWIDVQPKRREARLALAKLYADNGQHDLAASAIRPVLEQEPDDALSHALLAQELLLLQRNAEAIAYFRKALELNSTLVDDAKNVIWINNYAWVLATNADPALRNGDEAIYLAERLCKVSNFEQWGVVDTLAAAYAEAGRFDEAKQLMQQVLRRAQSDGDEVAADTATKRLAIYESHQPCREYGSAPVPVLVK